MTVVLTAAVIFDSVYRNSTRPPPPLFPATMGIMGEGNGFEDARWTWRCRGED